MNTENELFGELHEQEENGLFGNEHRRQYEAHQEALRLSAVSSSFSIQPFLEFEKEQKKIMRGNIEMYDIKGHHKYLTFAELFNWYVSRF